MPNVVYTSRSQFKEVVQTDLKYEPDTAIISISDTPEERQEMEEFCGGHTPAVFVDFPDVSERGASIGIDNANKLVDFIVANKGKTFLIHCFAGVSRSAAVAKFAVEVVGYGQFTSPIYNSDVYDTLYGALAGETLAGYYQRLQNTA